MAGKDDDFLSENFTPPSDAGSADDIVAVFPGMAESSAALEARERAYFADPLNSLPVPFEESEAGECDPLAPHEIQMIETFNARYGVNFTENDWRALHGYPPLTEKEITS